MKRVLFLTCWCRKQPSQFPQPPIEDDTSFPLPISSSFTPVPPAIPPPGTAQARSLRVHRPHNRSNAKPGGRKSKLNVKSADASKAEVESVTIPIRGMEGAKATRGGRMASSAPSAFQPLGHQHHHQQQLNQVPLAKMKRWGLQTQADAREGVDQCGSGGTSEVLDAKCGCGVAMVMAMTV